MFSKRSKPPSPSPKILAAPVVGHLSVRPHFPLMVQTVCRGWRTETKVSGAVHLWASLHECDRLSLVPHGRRPFNLAFHPPPSPLPLPGSAYWEFIGTAALAAVGWACKAAAVSPAVH